ncbi:MAG: hypothetical protein LBK03_05395, partial [Bacteroidales bacterium]|nr:hypothetical protein [Bacteroidales bacterium]
MKNNLSFGLIIGGLSLSIALLNIEIPKASDYSGSFMPSARGNASQKPTTDKKAGDPLFYPSTSISRSEALLLPEHPEHTPAANPADKAGTAAFAYNLGEAGISGEAGVLSQETELTISGLETRELPPLEQGMVNVTGDYAAYRMLPHGTRFNSNIDIVLPYDTALLPIGYAPSDIMTYYYDELRLQWVPIPRDTVDEANRLVYSKVNHFTDFINAVIKTPDMPETQAYVPTSIKGLKAANPLEGINIIAPPTPNNSGSANLGYPIEIPAGRNGMQPGLALAYSSAGGSGWLGMGWDMGVPMLAVETRWGVPRYDPLLESEDYLLSGQQLVTKDAGGNYLPMVHRGDWRTRPTDTVTQFYTRIEGAFLKIIRHGNSPKSYWWEVHDKNGMTYYYGKDTKRDYPNPDAVLTDALQNIAKWGLTMV